MSDTTTMIIPPHGARKDLHVHIRGFYGDGGENEGVLSVNAVLDASPFYPESGLISVGSPQQSPLIEGYIPNLGMFSCGPDAAERLIATLQEAVRAVREAMASHGWEQTNERR